MTTQLPEGWTIDESEDAAIQNKLPQGWSIEEEAATAKERDEAKLKKAAGPYQVEEKTPEELKNMSVWERMEYAQDLNRQREFLQSSQIVKGALSGLTFGASENIDALKPIEFEETNPYSIIETGSKVAGSLIPLSKLMTIIKNPATKLAAKSPVFQKQISSLLTMFGVGATDEALHSLAKGEVPTADEVLEHGVEWAALDGLLQATGLAGRFAKSLFTRSKVTGVPRKQLVNAVNDEIAASGVDLTNAEAVSAKALEILEAPLSEAELAAAPRKIQLAQAEESEVAKVAQEAIKPEPITPKELKTKKITDEPINRLTSEIRTISEPYQPDSINFTKEAEVLERDALQSQIDSVAERAATEEELGNAIREDIESQLESRKAEYRPLYNQSEEAAESTMHIPQTTAREAGEKLKRISRLKTKPEGYAATIRSLEDILEDAGFSIQRSEDGTIEQIISVKEVPVSDTIELARRLNEMIDYEAVEPTVKEVLRSVARAAKQDVREGLRAVPDALTAFELAEEAHAQTAKRFSKDNIRNIRGKEAGEKIAKMAESPSALGDLREVLSPKQMLQLEREMLEKLNNQSFEKAQKSLRELERHLSAENRKLAREIVEAKNPHNPMVRKKVTQDAILNDMSNAFTNGSRPEKTLGLWKTPKGQKLVKETFHNSPNWPIVKDYLEKQSFNDMLSSVLKDGRLDLKKYKSFMRDPATVNNIRAQGGDEAVTFFRHLDSMATQFEGNAKLLEKFPKESDIQRGKELLRKTKEKAQAKPKATKVGEESLKQQARIAKESTGERGSRILKRMTEKDFPLQAKTKKWADWFKDSMGFNEKAALSVFSFMKLGLPGPVISLVGFKIFNKMLTNPRVRRAFIEASKHQTNPLKFILALEHLGNELEE